MENAARHRVLELLKRHGWNATSFQLLESDFSYWFGEEACVGYVSTRFARVAAGAPIAEPSRIAAAADAFSMEARAAGRRVAFFAVERRLLEATALESVVVGEQPWWDPQRWSERRRRHRSIGEQIRRARAKGVMVTQLVPERAADPGSLERAAIERLVARWSATRPMPPMRFLVALEPFTFSRERLYFAAHRGGTLVGVLVAVPVYRRNGWFLEDLLRDPAAPNGTAESLVDAAMTAIAARGAEYATLGLAPLSSDTRWLRVSRRLLSGFYSFDGLRAFKSKLAPDGWDPIYLAWPRGGSALLALYDVLDAFASGRMIRFALGAFLRASPFVLRMLAAALVPWTALLLLPRHRRFFPSRAVQFAWGAFDAAMAAGLLRLSRRWSPRLASGLALAAVVDAGLTAVQATAWNIPRRRGLRDVALAAISVAAPLFAAAVLIGGIRRRRAPSDGDPDPPRP